MNAKRDLLETTQCLCLASRRAARTITRTFDRELRSHGIRATQFTLLAALELKGPQSIGDLAELLGAERTTVTRNLALVEKRSLVTIRPGADARSRIAAITQEGRDTLTGAFATWRKVQSVLTETIGNQAADGLRRLAGGPCVIGARTTKLVQDPRVMPRRPAPGISDLPKGRKDRQP